MTPKTKNRQASNNPMMKATVPKAHGLVGKNSRTYAQTRTVRKVVRAMLGWCPPMFLVHLEKEKVRRMVGMMMIFWMVFMVSLENPALTSS